MAKMVGYACSMKLSWLNEAVRMLKENLPETEFKKKMNEYLSYEIDSPTRLRKTREILMNVWFYPSEVLDPIRQEAIAILNEYPECSEARRSPHPLRSAGLGLRRRTTRGRKGRYGSPAL